MIPEEKTAAVTRALDEAFGETEFAILRDLTQGFSQALVFQIEVRGTPYLLRIIMRKDDPTGHFTCMKSAARASLAPRVLYANVEDKLSLTDFVTAVPFSRSEALRRMPATLRALHALPPFPPRAPQLNTTCTHLLNKPNADAYFQRFQAMNILRSCETERLLAHYSQLAAAYTHDPADMVSSHNDLFKPDNILFDGSKVWLVDWEAAFLNDRYADLAVVANMLVTDEAEETAFLEEYFGHAPNQHQRARFSQMQQLTHLFYTVVFLMFGSQGKPVNLAEPASDRKDVPSRFWSGDLRLDTNEAKLQYARYHWTQLKWNQPQR